jgi:hypothetical protein
MSSKPPSPHGTEHEKKKRRRKVQVSLQIKGEVNIFRGEKHFNFKNSF